MDARYESCLLQEESDQRDGWFFTKEAKIQVYILSDEGEMIFSIPLQEPLQARIEEGQHHTNYLYIDVHGPLSYSGAMIFSWPSKGFSITGFGMPVSRRRLGTHITVQREGKGITCQEMRRSQDDLNRRLKSIREIVLFKKKSQKSATVQDELRQLVEQIRDQHGGAGDVHYLPVHVQLVD